MSRGRSRGAAAFPARAARLRPRRRAGLGLVAVALGVVVLGGCRGGDSAPGPAPGEAGTEAAETAGAEGAEAGKVDAEAWEAACRAAGLGGRWYGAIGPERYEASLAEIQVCPRKVEVLVEDGPVYSVEAGGGVVAVSGGHVAQESLQGMGMDVGPSRVGLLADGELTPIPGLGSPRGGQPAVSDDGTLAYEGVEEDPPWTQSPLRTWDPETEQKTDVATAYEVSGLGWTRNGSLATTQPVGEGGASRVVVYRPDGSRKVHDVGVEEVRALVSDEAHLAAVAPTGAGPECCDDEAMPEPGVLLDLGSWEVAGRVPAGWKALAWSPDAAVLLVTRGDEVGVLPPGEGEVTVLGALPGGPLRNAAWVQ